MAVASGLTFLQRWSWSGPSGCWPQSLRAQHLARTTRTEPTSARLTLAEDILVKTTRAVSSSVSTPTITATPSGRDHGADRLSKLCVS